MANTNWGDDMRKAMAAAYAKDRDALASSQAGIAPYNSTKLSPDEEAMAYQFPERLFPKTPMTRDQARIQMKQTMGAAEYVAFIKRNAGGG